MRVAFFGDSLTTGVPGCSFFAILQERFPDDTLLNFGKGNDTVVSLYNRIQNLHLDQPFELAFLWIGVNDVPRMDGRIYRTLNLLLGQRPVKDMEELRSTYRSMLNLLCNNASHVIVVPPLLRGEDLENRWNRQLTQMGNLIRDITTNYPQVEFLDLRPVFVKKLEKRHSSAYGPRNPFRVLQDLLTLKSDERIDRKAVKRGFYLTLDGVHLNSIGARLVADAFSEVITKWRR
jgi:lysophospholipase L1-like esterase